MHSPTPPDGSKSKLNQDVVALRNGVPSWHHSLWSKGVYTRFESTRAYGRHTIREQDAWPAREFALAYPHTKSRIRQESPRILRSSNYLQLFGLRTGDRSQRNGPIEGCQSAIVAASERKEANIGYLLMVADQFRAERT